MRVHAARTHLVHIQRSISARVRELRRERRWTQLELARQLGLSQPRLSEIERGDGSFTAEQFLKILQLFNVDVREFAPAAADVDRDLQNALARHGARHLREDPSVVPSDRFSRPADALRAVLLDPRSDRHVTALAPVLVWSIDDIALPRVQNDLVQAGVPRRLGWLADNVLTAIAELPPPKDVVWRRRHRRADTVLLAFSSSIAPAPSGTETDGMPDPFDRGIQSRRTWTEVLDRASPISRRWRIASELGPDDFAKALEEARASR